MGKAVADIHSRQTEVFTRLTAQDSKLAKIDAIHSALVGDESLGQKGLVKRIEHVELHVTKMENLKIKLAGAVAGLSVAGSAVGSKLSDLLFGSSK